MVAACSAPATSPAASPGPDRESVLDAAWRSLELNTSSGDRANWEVVEVRQVTRDGFVEKFAGEPAPGCWKGPTPVPNEMIDPTQIYWTIQFRPCLAAPYLKSAPSRPPSPRPCPSRSWPRRSFWLTPTPAAWWPASSPASSTEGADPAPDGRPRQWLSAARGHPGSRGRGSRT